MTKRYISDIVTEEEIRTWKIGQRYLIKSGTGSGKSYFIRSNLYNYCKAKGFRILLFSNRNILKNQNLVEIGDEKSDTITAVNYQYVESQISNNNQTLDYYYNNFKILVFDECHYVFNDSQFNRFSDAVLQTIANPPKNKIVLLLTATPQVLLKYYDFPKENVYDMRTNYNYVTQLSFYNQKQTPEGVVQSLPEGEKCLYFGTAQDAWELKNKFDDSSFVCSQSNQLYKSSIVSPVIDQIVSKSSFESRLLAATKILDNGVNLIDPDLKTIVLDILDPVTLLQAIGRKRIKNDDDTVRLFIRDHNRGTINFSYMKVCDQLKQLADFEEMKIDEFVSKYKKKNLASVIDFDRQVNLAIKYNLIFLKEFYEKIMESRDGYKIEICKLLGKDNEVVKDGDVEVEKHSLKETMEKYVGVKLYKEEQEIFKQEFFNCVFAPKNTNYRHRGIGSISAVLAEDHLPYTINNSRDTFGTKRYFWIISKIQ